MMSHFNLKSLAFYGIAISSVVVLFKVVTAYGNTNLKAPPAMGGFYEINTSNLPQCLPGDSLLLNIQQSGVYLFADLEQNASNIKDVSVNKSRPSLNGRLSNQQFSLNGKIAEGDKCNNSRKIGKDKLMTVVKIQGVVNGEIISGKISFNSTPARDFTATRQPVTEESGKEH